MNGRREDFMLRRIPYFNGSIFAPDPDEGNSPDVPDLSQLDQVEIFQQIERASQANWRSVNPTIFGTLFERALDPSKRAQLGAHYTSESDIRLIVEPVLMQPLHALWEQTRAQAEPMLQRLSAGNLSPAEQSQLRARLTELHDAFMSKLGSTTVLDPACGSGNFLYVALRAMKDLEQRARDLFAPLNLEFKDIVTPRQFYGLEKEPFAARLAQIVVWIGYLQWRYEHEGALITEYRVPTHPRWLGSPILRDRDNPNDPNEPHRIQLADAILRYDANGKPYMPDWQPVDVIVSNPPFLGGKRLRTELGDQYVQDLFAVYDGCVPREADLVCYWFEQARRHLEQGKVKRIGMLATNSIRGGANREVLARIKRTGDIFMAWSDREWSLEGAAVRISMIGFDDGAQRERALDGRAVPHITPDLTASVDITIAKRLRENARIAFQGIIKAGEFELTDAEARAMLAAQNASGRSNADVIVRFYDAHDLVQRPSVRWMIDFGVNMPESEAAQYELPFAHVRQKVYPVRQKARRRAYRDRWWIHGEARPGLRQAIRGLSRVLCTTAVAKHRIFVWIPANFLTTSAVYTFAREDDYFFGVLHSYLHEVWSLRMGTSLEDRPRYTPTTTFETFPLPYAPGAEPVEAAEYRTIAAAAAALHRARDAWLNPPELADAPKALSVRTLTNLYNAVEAYRTGQSGVRLAKEAKEIAPQIAELHDALDTAVLAAYGWSDLMGNLRSAEAREEVLSRLLAENLRRAESERAGGIG
jgi:type II restriction/modification system DNA methylase subunit YeeA